MERTADQEGSSPDHQEPAITDTGSWLSSAGKALIPSLWGQKEFIGCVVYDLRFWFGEGEGFYLGH